VHLAWLSLVQGSVRFWFRNHKNQFRFHLFYWNWHSNASLICRESWKTWNLNYFDSNTKSNSNLGSKRIICCQLQRPSNSKSFMKPKYYGIRIQPKILRDAGNKCFVKIWFNYFSDIYNSNDSSETVLNVLLLFKIVLMDWKVVCIWNV
jgi:hypothetical protein